MNRNTRIIFEIRKRSRPVDNGEYSKIRTNLNFFLTNYLCPPHHERRYGEDTKIVRAVVVVRVMGATNITITLDNTGVFQRDSVDEFPAKFIGAISKILMTSTFVWCDKGSGYFGASALAPLGNIFSKVLSRWGNKLPSERVVRRRFVMHVTMSCAHDAPKVATNGRLTDGGKIWN
jgi:hypothetical protein